MCNILLGDNPVLADLLFGGKVVVLRVELRQNLTVMNSQDVDAAL